MEFVVAETRRPFKWFFDKGTRKYLQKEVDGSVRSWIFGEFLPNPLQIKKNFQDAIARGEDTNGRTDADPITYKLWEHWNGNNNH